MTIAIVIMVIAAIILISIAVYKDWARNFQNEYRDMMAGYERRKKDKNEK